jgi:hypothetical protein
VKALYPVTAVIELGAGLALLRGTQGEGFAGVSKNHSSESAEDNRYGPRVGTRKPPTRRAPKKISIARLPVTGSDVFGREEDIAFLDRAWANKDVNVVTIVAWAGVGKSTLVNHWLRRMAAKHYRTAELVFGWSFYRQGTSGDTSSADEFLDATLTWFGDPDPWLGTAWERNLRDGFALLWDRIHGGICRWRHPRVQLSRYKAMKDWHNHVGDMLAYMNDVLHPHGF